MDYGLQLYSVRDMTDKDLDGTLKKVAEIGYRYVEFAGFFGHSAEQVKACREAGILVNVWTVNGLEDGKRLAEYGVDFITSNILE